MGRVAGNFRQTKGTGGAGGSNGSYAKIDRQGSWRNRIVNILKLNRKGVK